MECVRIPETSLLTIVPMIFANVHPDSSAGQSTTSAIGQGEGEPVLVLKCSWTRVRGVGWCQSTPLTDCKGPKKPSGMSSSLMAWLNVIVHSPLGGGHRREGSSRILRISGSLAYLRPLIAASLHFWRTSQYRLKMRDSGQKGAQLGEGAGVIPRSDATTASEDIPAIAWNYLPSLFVCRV